MTDTQHYERQAAPTMPTVEQRRRSWRRRHTALIAWCLTCELIILATLLARW